MKIILKLTVKDIKILGRNGRVKKKIIEKFGTIEKFAEVAQMSAKTVKYYLNSKAEYFEQFKAKLSTLIGDYKDLTKNDIEQIEEYVETLTNDIHLYQDVKDIDVLEYILKLSNDYGLTDCVAKSYRNIGTYYLLTKARYNISLHYYNLAIKEAQKIENANIECMVVSDMIAAYTFMGAYKEGEKLKNEFEQQSILEKAGERERFWYYHDLTIFYLGYKDYLCAKDALSKAVLYTSNNYRKFKYFNLLGICHKNCKSYKNALFYYDEALKIANTDIEKALCYNNIATAYRAMKNRQLAEENIDKAMIYISPNDIKNYLAVYETYADIKGTKESINRLLDILEDSTEGQFMPYVLEVLSKYMNRIKDTERFKRIVIKYIDINMDNESMKADLLKLLGSLTYEEVKKK